MDPGPPPIVVPPAPHVMPGLDAALTRLGVRGSLARDAVLAGCVALASVGVLVPLLGPLAGQLGVTLGPPEQAAVLLLVAVQALLLVLRRIRPVTCLLAVATLQVGLATVLPVDVGVRVAAPIIAAYSVGAYRPARTVLRATLTALLLEVAGGALAAALFRPAVRALMVGPAAAGAEPPWSIGILTWILAVISIALLYAVAALGGLAVASRRRYAELVQEQLAATAAQEQARLRTALAGERSRMARELHDIAAHHLSGLVVQAAAAERLIDRDPEAAKQATRAIRAQGKETLANLRAVVGVLRESDQGPDPTGTRVLDAESGAPVPGLSALDRLLDAARASGDDLEAQVRGVAFDLPPLADVTVYRVLQEALTNARQHAAGQPVRVVQEWGPVQARFEVVNPVPEAVPARAVRPGYGLVGMRERAQLSGASLEAGPVNGTWRVLLAVPRPPAAQEHVPIEEAGS